MKPNLLPPVTLPPLDTSGSFFKAALTRYRWHLLAMVLAAFAVRATIFTSYMREGERYRQPDTSDYQSCAQGLVSGAGFVRTPSGEPIFWRTPGYPWFLARMYRDALDAGVQEMDAMHQRILWLQILLCSLLPVLLFLLAYILTGLGSLSCAAGWIAVLHLGFVLTSMHLQTDGVALLFLVPFFMFFYRSFSYTRSHPESQRWMMSMAGAAICLGLYTWIRPMGMFVAQVSTIILLFCSDGWKDKFKKMAVFWLVFLAVIGGWYARNYQLTGKLFYNPTFGPTLGLFCVPKILRSTTGAPLETCWKTSMQQMGLCTFKAMQEQRKSGSPHVVVKEMASGDYIFGVIKAHPFLFLRDWLVQVIKTSFDLYAHLLVACEKKTQWYDDLEDFLTVKLGECLVRCPVPFWMRAVAWLELCALVLMWAGVFAGFVLFLLMACCTRWSSLPAAPYREAMVGLWLKCGMMVGGLLAMTGAFGYARLRLPADLLLIILSLTFWWWVLCVIRSTWAAGRQ